MSDQLSLRERKKERTRSALVEVSSRLFAKQGYAETTLEQICAVVEVAVPTLLRYFPSKEQLALAPYIGKLHRFREAIGDPTRQVDALTFWRAWVTEEAMLYVSTSPETALAHRRMIEREPILLAGTLKVEHGYQDILAETLAREAGASPDDDLHSRLLAAMLTAGNDAVLRRWTAAGGRTDLVAECQSVVDFAIQRFPHRSRTEGHGNSAGG